MIDISSILEQKKVLDVRCIKASEEKKIALKRRCVAKGGQSLKLHGLGIRIKSALHDILVIMPDALNLS